MKKDPDTEAEDDEDIQKAFRDMDTNNDGVLSLEEVEAKHAEKKKQKLGSLENLNRARKAFTCRKCLAKAKTKLSRMASGKVQLVYAVYNILVASGLIYWVYIFPDSLDVSWGKFKQAWLWIFAQCIVIIVALAGVYAAIQRNPGLARSYFLAMPIMVICNLPATYMFFKMGCKCSNFKQCAALRAFAEYNGQDFIIPHPVPPNSAKYGNQVRLPWKIAPGKDDQKTSLIDLFESTAIQSEEETRSGHFSEEETSLTQQVVRSHVRRGSDALAIHYAMEALMGETGDSIEVLPLPFRVNPQITDLEEGEFSGFDLGVGSETENSTFQTSSMGQRTKGDFSRLVLEVSESGAQNSSSQTSSLAQEQPLLSDVEPVNDDASSTSLPGSSTTTTTTKEEPVARSNVVLYKRPGAEPDEEYPEESIDPRKVYIGHSPLKAVFVSKAEGVEREHCDKIPLKLPTLATGSEYVKKGTDVKKQLIECRKAAKVGAAELWDSGFSAAARCPPDIEKALLHCALNDSCGGMKFIVTSMNESGGAFLIVEQCTMTYPVIQQKNVHTMDADDDSDEWNTRDPLILYFVQDTTEALHKTGSNQYITRFGRKIAPALQSEMSSEDWLNYMVHMRDSGCHCSLESRGCYTYYDKSTRKYEYWCKIKRTDRERCLLHQMPGGSPRKINLLFWPGNWNNLWTKDVCMATGDNAFLPKAFDEYGRKDTRAPECSCFEGTGYRVPKKQFNLLSPKIIEAYGQDGMDEMLIGYHCNKWMKADEQRWCIVGFDSACADREEVPISFTSGSSTSRLRLFKSSIPCQKEELSLILNDATQMCNMLKTCVFLLDGVRYVLFPVMLFWMYKWSTYRCQDGQSMIEESDFVNPAEEEERHHLESSASSYSSYESDDVAQDSRDERRRSQPKTKAQGGTASDSWDDDEDQPSKQKGTSKKESSGTKKKKDAEDKSSGEWSDDDDKPLSKSKDKSSGEWSDDDDKPLSKSKDKAQKQKKPR